MRSLTAAGVLAAGLLAAAASAQAPGFVPGQSRLGLNGLGAIKLGMTERQFDAATSISMRRSRTGPCTFYDAGPPGTPQGPSFRFQDGRLVVIKSGTRRYVTFKNVGFRSRVTTVRRKYPGSRTTRSLGGGQYVRWDGSSGDRGFGFFIAGGRVEQAATGLKPFIDQQECA